MRTEKVQKELHELETYIRVTPGVTAHEMHDEFYLWTAKQLSNRLWVLSSTQRVVNKGTQWSPRWFWCAGE